MIIYKISNLVKSSAALYINHNTTTLSISALGAIELGKSMRGTLFPAVVRGSLPVLGKVFKFLYSNRVEVFGVSTTRVEWNTENLE